MRPETWRTWAIRGCAALALALTVSGAVAQVDEPPDREVGYLRIQTIPWTHIYLDGVDTGRNTPVHQLPVSVGRHQVRLVASDGRTVEVSVDVRARELLSIERQL